jgi:hypothetical protein
MTPSGRNPAGPTRVEVSLLFPLQEARTRNPTQEMNIQAESAPGVTDIQEKPFMLDMAFHLGDNGWEVQHN